MLLWIKNKFYLTEPDGLSQILDITDLEQDEIEDIVGRFKPSHWQFPGLLRGEVIEYIDGKVEIRHHFKKELLWSSHV